MSKTKNLTAHIIEDEAIEVSINFDIDFYNDTLESEHEDNQAPVKAWFFENVQIKSIEAVFYGVGVDITDKVILELKKNEIKFNKLIKDLENIAKEQFDDEPF